MAMRVNHPFGSSAVLQYQCSIIIFCAFWCTPIGVRLLALTIMGCILNDLLSKQCKTTRLWNL